jgi:hypothetical protein
MNDDVEPMIVVNGDVELMIVVNVDVVVGICEYLIPYLFFFDKFYSYR